MKNTITYNYTTDVTLLVVTLLAVMLLPACYRTELCYEHYPKVAVSLDWEHEWERDYGRQHPANWKPEYHGYEYDDLRPGTPEWVNLMKFVDNSQADKHYMEAHGGDILLMDKGEHSFLLYNGDTEYIVLSDIASIPDARASATPRSRASINYVKERHPDTKSANPPDILYSAYVDQLPDIKIHETKQLPVKMQPLVYTYLIRYEFDYGQQHIALARGALGGMAESVYLRDGRTSEETTIVLFDCDIKDYGCEAQVRSFGAPGFPDEYYGRSDGDTPARPYTLNLEVMLTNGTTMEFNYDIDDQLRNQPRGGVITVKGLRIEDEDNKTAIDSGFDVDLSGWGEVDIDLPVTPQK